jgi:hypothetical protein
MDMFFTFPRDSNASFAARYSFDNLSVLDRFSPREEDEDEEEEEDDEEEAEDPST